jgi:2-methylcitrate dehydratase PrpD
MNQQTQDLNDGTAYTSLLAEWISSVDDAAISPRALEWARHVILDWVAVAIAGSSEPLVRMLIAEYGEAGDLPCSLLAGGGRARPLEAALINGSAGHALDFDDVSSSMFGHPTVPVAPATLALAQVERASGRDLLRAMVVGHEVESRVGAMVGPSHYRHGFHATGTVGTFGAAAACANLKKMDASRTAHALGLAATQAAGLKCMFGTMSKPLHAGKAAMNGLMAAQLAARGFTANERAIECAQGFARTQAPEFTPFPAFVDTSAGFTIENTLFKYHASCYLTHSTIEAIRLLRLRHSVGLEDLDAMTILVASGHRGVCDIDNPQTGLNVKFSIKHLAALALDGVNTAALDLYSTQTALNERIVQARRRITLTFDEDKERSDSVVTIRTCDGRELTADANVAIPSTDLDAQWDRLVDKARHIVEPVMGPARFKSLVSAIEQLDHSPSLQPLFEAIQ